MEMHRAQKRRVAKMTIGLALRSLDDDDRRIVLEDLLADAEQASKDNLSKAPIPGAFSATPSKGEPAGAEAPGDELGGPIWKRVYDFCIGHPRHDGVYNSNEVARALEIHADHTRGATYVTNAVQRKATNGPRGDKVRDPKFVWIGNGAGQFRLYSPSNKV